jgi:hypothetical protein
MPTLGADRDQVIHAPVFEELAHGFREEYPFGLFDIPSLKLERIDRTANVIQAVG